MSRRLEKRIAQIVIVGVVVSFVVVGILLCASLVVYLVAIETAVQQNLPKIQTALDEACGRGVLVAEARYYDGDFSGYYYSPQAHCTVVSNGEYSCQCSLTPTPPPNN